MKKMDKSLHGVYFSPDMFPIMGSEPKQSGSGVHDENETLRWNKKFKGSAAHTKWLYVKVRKIKSTLFPLVK